MRFTSTQQLPCPEGSDMAAVALYMQCFAEQVESTLTEQSAEFATFLNPPVAVWRATAPQVLNDGDFITFGAVDYDNWPTVPSSTSPSLPNVRGWYYIGANVTLVDAPAVVNQMYMILLTATQNTGIVGDPVIAQFQDTVFESNTGGENPLVAGTVFFASGEYTNPSPVDLTLRYRTSSLVNPVPTTLTPASRLWVAYLGDTPQIGVS